MLILYEKKIIRQCLLNFLLNLWRRSNIVISAIFIFLKYKLWIKNFKNMASKNIDNEMKFEEININLNILFEKTQNLDKILDNHDTKIDNIILELKEISYLALFIFQSLNNKKESERTAATEASIKPTEAVSIFEKWSNLLNHYKSINYLEWFANKINYFARKREENHYKFEVKGNLCKKRTIVFKCNTTFSFQFAY